MAQWWRLERLWRHMFYRHDIYFANTVSMTSTLPTQFAWHLLCQHSSQPRCLSWSYSLFPTANLLRLSYLLSWTSSDQCDTPLSDWRCYQNTVVCVCSFKTRLLQVTFGGLSQVSSFSTPKSAKQCCKIHFQNNQICSRHSYASVSSLATYWAEDQIQVVFALL